MSQEQPFLQQVRDTSNTTLDVLLSNLSANIGTAYGQANTAYAQANNSLAVGQAAYAQANVGIVIAEQAYAAANAASSAAATAQGTANFAVNVAEAAYATANVGISASGVTPGSYGSGSQIPVFTLDARGRITTITTVAYNLFTPTSSGIVRASGGGTTNFLRADGNWAAPSIALNQNFAANGFVQLQNGLTLQWGVYNKSLGGESAIQTDNFPFAFNTACLYCSMTPNGATPVYVNNTNATRVIWATSFGGGAIATTQVRLFAIGF